MLHCMITTRRRGLLLKMHHTSINFLITSVIQFNEVVLNPTSDAQIDPRVLYWVKYTDLEGWVLVIHYYTKRDPTIEVHILIHSQSIC